MLGAQKRLSRLERKNPIRRSNRKKPSPETIKIIVLAAKEKIRREWGERICGGAKEEGKLLKNIFLEKQNKELLFVKTDSHWGFTCNKVHLRIQAVPLVLAV